MINKNFIIAILVGIYISTNVSGQNIPSSNRYIDVYKKYLNAGCPLENDSIRHFVYFAGDRELIYDHPFLKIKRFAGAQIMYSWRELEPERGNYDFSAVRADYEYLRSCGKKLFIQLQDANFMPGEWLPGNDKGYLRSIYQYGEEIGVGLGGPDLMMKRKGQLNHTIAMMHEGRYTVPLGIAIQDGNYIEETGNNLVVADRQNIVPVHHAFAKDFLKVRYMFWVCQEPYFTEDVILCFQTKEPAGSE